MRRSINMLSLVWNRQFIKTRKGILSIMVGRTNRKGPRVIDFDKSRLAQKQDDRRGPTDERTRIAQASYSIGSDRMGGSTWTMQDAPLDRLRKQDKMPSLRYEALNKFRIHWYEGNLAGSIGSMNIDRVFASDVTRMDGLPKGHRQIFHREQYHEGRAALKALKSDNDSIDDATFAHKCIIVVDSVLLAEQSLVVAGFAIGAKSPYRARELSKDYLAVAADCLINQYGLAGKRR